MKLNARVRRLERHDNGTERGCPGCGFARGAVPRNTPVRVFMDGERPPGPTHCPVCKRQLAFTLAFDRDG